MNDTGEIKINNQEYSEAVIDIPRKRYNVYNPRVFSNNDVYILSWSLDKTALPFFRNYNYSYVYKTNRIMLLDWEYVKITELPKLLRTNYIRLKN